MQAAQCCWKTLSGATGKHDDGRSWAFVSRALSNRHTCWQHCCPVLQAQTDRLSIPAMCSPVAPLSDLGLAKHASQAQLILLDLLLAGLARCTRGAVGLGVLHGRETQCAQEHCGADTPLWPQLSNLWRHPTLQKLQVWQAVRRHTGACGRQNTLLLKRPAVHLDLLGQADLLLLGSHAGPAVHTAR